jgi:hypothetical protein
MSQDQKSFTVSDRRHFKSDGEAREDTPEAPPVVDRKEEARSAPAEPSSRAARPADFSQFILSLAAQAGFLLSGQAGAEGPSPAEALEDVRGLISILEMLKDKTEGRRTPEEDRILEGILYELRLGYLARAEVGGA